MTRRVGVVVLAADGPFAACSSGSSSGTSSGAAAGVPASSSASATGTIRVLAAASLTESFTTIGKQISRRHTQEPR